MKCSESYAEYIRILSQTDNTFVIIGEALETLWDAYHIAGMSLQFKISSTLFSPEGISTDEFFSVKGKMADRSVSFSREYITGEGGIVKVDLYNGQGCLDWTEEEKNDLDRVLDVFLFHCGRFRLIKMLQQGNLTDFATGLSNTQGFLKSISRLFSEKQLQQYNGYCFNLKRFGLVNKVFGKEETDRILCRYAAYLKRFIDEDEYVGRLGGDNFVALIKKEKAKQFIDFLSGVKTYGVGPEGKKEVILSAIAGIFEIDDTLEDYEQIISYSAVALNVAKNIARLPYVYVTPKLIDHIEKEKQIVADFPQAIAEKEFKVYYQPKVETDAYWIVGAEALVRWQHNGKTISPREFIPVLEQNGFVCNLDFYVLEQVCADIADWKSRGLKPVKISVNFSRKNLSNPMLAENIVSILDKYDIERKYIEIELTETIDEEEHGRLSLFVKQMMEHKISISIDDFGTGYSSLNVLRMLPVEVLKIDKTFIDNVEKTESDSIVLSHIIQMAKQLNMDVVSEGVENWEQVEFLQDIDCNIVQGFLFDKPMKKEEFEERLCNKQYDVTKVKDYIV